MKKWLVLCIISIFCVFSSSIVAAESDSDRLQNLNKQIEEYQRQLKTLQSQAQTLSNQIAQFDAQIKVSELKIDQTQSQILLLGGRIDQLQLSLTNLSDAFASRAVETYRLSRMNNLGVLLFTANNLGDAVTRYHYLQKIQEADRTLLSRLQTVQNTYKQQKGELEELEKLLNEQKAGLDKQKIAKASLLTVTKNDEKKYQQLLAAARAEFEAIQAIIAGKGEETEVGQVSEGQKIASIIQGPSCNSSGAHLHFIVSKNGTTENPFSHLRSGVDYQNCSGPGECSEGDPFNPSGSWNWPINPKIKYNQGYGRTWAVQNTWTGKIYQFHNGIDINSSGSSEVKAVRSGKLYRGSYAGSAGCKLRYVRVDHNDSDIDTFYLHIDY